MRATLALLLAGILEQGSRLSEVVSQLQAALHPAASNGVVPPALLAGGGSNPSATSQLGSRQALPGSTSSNGSSASSSSGGSQQRQPALPARPALPSSSIGSDYQRGASSSGEATIDMSIDDLSRAQLSTHPPTAGGGSGSKLTGSGSSSSAAPVRNAVPYGGTVSGSRASADLLNVLMPLLASASNLAAVSGVAFVMAEHGSGSSSDSGGSNSSGSGSAPGTAAPQQLALPAAEVAVGPGTLKRMLSQLIDGIIACAARGDVVQASVQPRQWQGRPGVAIMLCCAYGLNHSSGSGAAGTPVLARPPLQPEFAFLHTTAAEAGGMFEVHADATPDVAHLNSSALAATLWLPTVPTHGAGWS